MLNLPIQTAVKTGTSNDYRDAWAVGFSDRHTVGVWMGNVDRQPMYEVTGSLGPALVLRAVFAELRRHTLSRSLVVHRQLVPRQICATTGELATDRCPSMPEWFRRDAVPESTCARHAGPQRPQPGAAPNAPVRIESPTPGLHIALDPHIPDELERFVFRVSVGRDARRVEWVLDDEVVATAARVLWQPTRGRHLTRARVWLADGTLIETDPVSFLVK